MILDLPEEIFLLMVVYVDFFSLGNLYLALPPYQKGLLDNYIAPLKLARVFNARLESLELIMEDAECSGHRINSRRMKTLTLPFFLDLWHEISHLHPHGMALEGWRPEHDDIESFRLMKCTSNIYNVHSMPYRKAVVKALAYIPPKNTNFFEVYRGGWLVGLDNGRVQIIRKCCLKDRLVVLCTFFVGETVNKIAVSKRKFGLACLHLKYSQSLALADLSSDHIGIRKIPVMIRKQQVNEDMFLSAAGCLGVMDETRHEVIRLEMKQLRTRGPAGPLRLVAHTLFTKREFVDDVYENPDDPVFPEKDKARFYTRGKRVLMLVTNKCSDQTDSCMGALHRLRLVEFTYEFDEMKDLVKWDLRLPKTFRLMDWRTDPEEEEIYFLMMVMLEVEDLREHHSFISFDDFVNRECHEDHFVVRPKSLAVYKCPVWFPKDDLRKLELVFLESDEQMPSWRLSFNYGFRRLVARECFLHVTANHVHVVFPHVGILSWNFGFTSGQPGRYVQLDDNNLNVEWMKELVLIFIFHLVSRHQFGDVSGHGDKVVPSDFRGRVGNSGQKNPVLQVLSSLSGRKTHHGLHGKMQKPVDPPDN